MLNCWVGRYRVKGLCQDVGGPCIGEVDRFPLSWGRAMSSPGAHHAYHASSEPKRRDLLSLIASAGAAIGLGAIAWPLIDFMNPSADVVAGGAPIDIDLSKIEPGQQIVVLWRGAPILIVNRTPAALKTLQAPTLISLLSDPTSSAHQQPPYADNWHRSIKPTYAVLVGICTHLDACRNISQPPTPPLRLRTGPAAISARATGQSPDLAGRVYKSVPAPLNLPVPPYNFVNDKTLRLGENPPGQTFELSSVIQM